MRLLFIGYLHGFGGAEKMLIMLANAMSERNHEVHLVSLVADTPQYPINIKVEYKYIHEHGKNRLLIIKNRYSRLKKYIMELQPDLIINFWLQSTYFCAFMGSDIARKTIYAERGDPHDNEYRGLLGFIRSISFKKIRGFVFQSRGAQSCFGDMIKKRSCIIHNPVFIKEGDFPVPVLRDKRIVTVGRLHEQKNQSLLIEAFSMLPEDMREFTLEIYGEGELKDQLQGKINDLELTDRVFLRGVYKDIHQRIATASLFVLSSDYEGMPNALVEAVAIGLPCVSTDFKPGGARELIRNGENGVIVSCNDARELMCAMNQVLNDCSKSNQCSFRARQVIKELNPENIYSKWEVFFHRMSV